MISTTTALFTARAQYDLRTLSEQLAEMQRQVAEGSIAPDFKGFGAGATQLLTAQSLKSAADTKNSLINQLGARFEVQGAALQQVADGARALALSIRTAISANDGRGITTDFELNFGTIVSALNETWNGQPLFAGERLGKGPIKISSLAELASTPTTGDIFDEASRDQQVDVGTGSPLTVAKRASEMSQGLFDAMRSLKGLVDANNGVLGQPIPQSQQDTLRQIAAALDEQATAFNTESGRAGQVQAVLQRQATQLQNRSDLLTKEIGDQRDADPAEVAVKISLLQTQYQASAKIFADLSKLSLLNYL